MKHNCLSLFVLITGGHFHRNHPVKELGYEFWGGLKLARHRVVVGERAPMAGQGADDSAIGVKNYPKDPYVFLIPLPLCSFAVVFVSLENVRRLG